MVETAALLVDHVLPHRPVRQWVLSFPYPLRFLLASQAQRVGSDDQRAGCPIPGTPGAPSQGWLSRDEQSDHLNLSLDDEEGATLQQLPRPLDHVPDSHGAAGGSQSAQRLRGPVQTKYLPGKRMIVAPASLAGLGVSRCMPGWR